MSNAHLLAFSPIAFLCLTSIALFNCDPQVQAAPENRIALENSSHAHFAFASFSADASLLAAGEDRLRVWDTQTGRIRTTLHPPAFAIAFSADGMMLAGTETGRGNDIDLWALRDEARLLITYGATGPGSADSGKLIRKFQQPRSERIGLSAAFSPDTKWLAIGNGDDTITLFELATGKEVTLPQEQSNGAAIGFSNDGKYLASGGRDGTIRVWEVNSQAEKHCLRGYPDPVAQVAFGDRDRLIVAAAVEPQGIAGKSTVFVNRFPDGKELARFPNCSHPVLTTDGRFLAMLGTERKTVSIRDLKDRSLVFEYVARNNSRFKAISFTPNKTLICLLSEKNQLFLLRLQSAITKK